MRRLKQVVCCLATILVALSAAITHADVFNMPSGQTSLQFVSVGDPGNAPDTRVMDDGTSGYGTVGYTYQIGKYDVTVGQYTQFLNAVAKTDTYGLYNSAMATDLPTIGITQSGSAGSYSYSVTGSYIAGPNCPIFDVSWGDAARFSNWLQNGQPVGAQGPGTTETGVYNLNGAMTDSALIAIPRNAGATYVIPSENEWYKAAYYKSGGTNAGYWSYPTQSNIVPSNVLSATGVNNANFYDFGNCSDPTNGLTPVGAFAASPGPYGTFDQGGNVFEWNEAALNSSLRGLRGGSFWYPSGALGASNRVSDYPWGQGLYNQIGFRVASVPEPSSLVLLSVGAIILLAYAWRKKINNSASVATSHNRQRTTNHFAT